MASADDQRIAVQAFEEQLKMPERCALQSFDTLTGNQCVAMDSHETVAELVLEGFERFIKQDFAGLMTQGHVLMIGNEVHHLIQGNQFDPLTGSGADMAARAVATFGSRSGQGRELGAIGTLGSFQRIMQLFSSHRFHQIAYGAGL
ncbi:hypothetical protein D3C84_981520 [compost metagenome]